MSNNCYEVAKLMGAVKDSKRKRVAFVIYENGDVGIASTVAIEKMFVDSNDGFVYNRLNENIVAAINYLTKGDGDDTKDQSRKKRTGKK